VKRVLALAALVALALLLTSCSTSDTPDFPTVVTLGGAEIYPTIINSSLAVGENRVSMSITDRDDNKVLDAAMHLRYYNLNGKSPKFLSDADARFIPIALSYVDEQSNKETSPTGDDGVYVSYADFDEPGDWGIEITITRDGKKLRPVPFRFNVLDKSPEPGIGDPAPASVQMIAENVSNIDEIDSSFPPRPGMHDLTIADAVRSGKPAVIAFATPAFCRSRTCAPVMDTVMDPLFAKYQGRANFIHVEPYALGDLRRANVQTPVPAAREWRLATEPWIFVVDRQGKIVAKYEGIVAADEVESTLAIALDERPASVSPVPSPASN
jgi:major membrane immunogen (membrane-anchored lipoprotein)